MITSLIDYLVMIYFLFLILVDKCVPHEDGHIGVGESGGHMGSSSFLELYTIFCSARERKLEQFFNCKMIIKFG